MPEEELTLSFGLLIDKSVRQSIEWAAARQSHGIDQQSQIAQGYATSSQGADEDTMLRLAQEVFELAAGRLGILASELNLLTEENALALGTIEAQGDRIDRLNADNRATLQHLESVAQ